MSPSSWILLVSDREQGTVLFGTSHERPGETLTPFPIGALSSLCTTGSCPTTTWMALDVPNATPSPLSDGTSATLTFGGQAYRLWVHASDQHLDPAACGVESFVPPLPLALTYVAKDLAGLAAGLPPSAE